MRGEVFMIQRSSMRETALRQDSCYSSIRKENMGVQGRPGKYTMVVAENDEDSPWEPRTGGKRGENWTGNRALRDDMKDPSHV